jgi:hypothetical protein
VTASKLKKDTNNKDDFLRCSVLLIYSFNVDKAQRFESSNL